MSAHPPIVWIGFTALVIALLVVDLGVLNRRGHVLSVREASAWSAGLVALAVIFGGFSGGGRVHSTALNTSPAT